MQYISILGSTGSIGTQALDVIAANRDKFAVVALAAYSNEKLLKEQIEVFNPEIAVLVDENAAKRLAASYKGKTIILTGQEGLTAAATHTRAQTILTSLVGFAGLKPTLQAITAGKNIALANKETLVAAGELVTSFAKEKNVKILPVDSEHSAILQCLRGEEHQAVRRLILTASGGPFRGWSRQQLESVTVAACLKHPNWAMGKKITVDSATLINKGLEVIEARWLFNINFADIEVVIHPQSIIHSMVEFLDGVVMAQMGMPDMRVPIQYALTYPERVYSNYPKLNFTKMSQLTFESPDTVNFSGLTLAYEVGKAGGTLPCVFNAANEIAVQAFLKGRVKFLHIADIAKYTLEKHDIIHNPTLAELDYADAWARETAIKIINSRYT